MNNRCRFTKAELSKDLGITRKRLLIELRAIETDPEFMQKFPTYSKNCQILRPPIYKYIFEQLSIREPEEIITIMKEQRAKNNFGV